MRTFTILVTGGIPDSGEDLKAIQAGQEAGIEQLRHAGGKLVAALAGLHVRSAELAVELPPGHHAPAERFALEANTEDTSPQPSPQSGEGGDAGAGAEDPLRVAEQSGDSALPV